MAVIKIKRILKCLLMIVVSLLLVFKFTIWVSASSGYDRQEADAFLIDWAKEYNVPYHEIEVHPNRPGAASNISHFHIGKTGHIPIIGDIPTWLEEVLYDN